MDSTQKALKNSNPVLPFKPAELAKWQNGEWRIVFYCIKPGTKKYKRYTRRVPPITGIKKREEYARKMIDEINTKIENGWSPEYENTTSGAFSPLTSVFDTYLSRLRKSVIDGEKRKATLVSYESYINQFIEWLKKTENENIMTIELDQEILMKFLDYIHYDKKNSATTHNNYLTFFSAFSTYLLNRKIIIKNPTSGINKKKQTEKTRTAIPEDVRLRVFDYFEKHNKQYLLICKLMYYLLLRRTEMAKIKVSDFQFQEGVLLIRPEVSKNNKKQYITLLDDVIPELKQHIKNAHPSLYVFSEGFVPGRTQINPKRLSYPWEKMKKILKLENHHQLYSLKDAGITDLLNAGVPAIVVRDHARHHDISVTQKYTLKGRAANKELLVFRKTATQHP